MKAIFAFRGPLWLAEVVFAAIMTASLLPVMFLYLLDLAAGTVAPGAAWALGAAIGMVGVWVALVARDSLFQRKPAIRWLVVSALALAIIFLAYLTWGSMRAGNMEFGFLVTVSAVGVALHQLVRLTRL